MPGTRHPLRQWHRAAAAAALAFASAPPCLAQSDEPGSENAELLQSNSDHAAPPTRGGFGQIGLGLGLGAALPFGGLGGSLDQRDLMGPGLDIAVELGFGVSERIAVGPWFQFQSLSSASDCTECGGSSRGIGAMLFFQPLSGSYWDLWGGAGIGYRATSASLSATDERTYRGFEWAHAQLGLDWYPSGKLGYGPVAGVDAGSFSDESGGGIADRRIHWSLTFGLRLVYKTEPFSVD